MGQSSVPLSPKQLRQQAKVPLVAAMKPGIPQLTGPRVTSGPIHKSDLIYSKNKNKTKIQKTQRERENRDKSVVNLVEICV